jgi:hypothetical protein
MGKQGHAGSDIAIRHAGEDRSSCEQHQAITKVRADCLVSLTSAWLEALASSELTALMCMVDLILLMQACLALL